MKNGAVDCSTAPKKFGRTPLQTEGFGEMPEDQVHQRFARMRSG
jgi:hypothetical protein